MRSGGTLHPLPLPSSLFSQFLTSPQLCRGVLPLFCDSPVPPFPYFLSLSVLLLTRLCLASSAFLLVVFGSNTGTDLAGSSMNIWHTVSAGFLWETYNKIQGNKWKKWTRGQREGGRRWLQDWKETLCVWRPHSFAHFDRAINLMSDYVTLQNTNLLFSMICAVGSSLSRWISRDEQLSFGQPDYSIQTDTIVKSAHYTQRKHKTLMLIPLHQQPQTPILSSPFMEPSKILSVWRTVMKSVHSA